MNTAILILTTICAIGAAITSVPVVMAWRRTKKREVVVGDPPSGIGKWLLVFCMAIVAFTFSAFGLYRTFRPDQITPDNVESSFRSWCDARGIGVQKQVPNDQMYFSYLLALRSGNQVTVYRSKLSDKYLRFQYRLDAPKDILSEFSKLTDDKAILATQELELELAKLHTSVDVTGAPRPVSIAIMKEIAIANLNETAFIERIDEIDSDAIICRLAWAVITKRAKATL